MMSSGKVEALSKLILDLGKVLFGASVIGFFIPGFSGSVNFVTFVMGAIFSVALFTVGIKLTR